MQRAAGIGAMRTKETVDFALRGELITLDALLKATGLAASGGEAKALIANGQVSVNGQPETRRGRKLRSGDLVQLGPSRINVRPSSTAATSAGAESATPATTGDDNQKRNDHGMTTE